MIQNGLKPGFVVSPVIIGINVLVFLGLALVNLSFTQYSGQSLYWFGVNYSPWVDQGQWWRLFTSMFLHFGLMHLAFNSISLMFLGRIIEPLLGSINFAWVYVVAGMAGSFASYTFNKEVFSAGASGAVFGLFGVFIAVLLGNLLPKATRDAWLKSVGAILAINLGLGLILPVDNAAHLGGLFSGMILGFAMLPLMKKRLRNILLSRLEQERGL